jgi:hypothetical protein
MRWADERYVRLYTRDTADWEMLPWQSRAFFPLLLRKVDRAGQLNMGKHGLRGVAQLVGVPEEFVEEGLAGLVEDGCVGMEGSVLVVRNFVAAQETPSSNAKRKRIERERKRDAQPPGEDCKPENNHVTLGHAESRDVTAGHAMSRSDLPSLAMPNLAFPEEAYTHTARAYVDVCPPAHVDESLERLAITWEAAGLPMASSSMRDIADLISRLAASRGIVDLDELALGLFKAFGRFRDCCGIKPAPSPFGFMKHWETVVEWYDGKGKPPTRGDPSKGRNGISPPTMKEITTRPYAPRSDDE